MVLVLKRGCRPEGVIEGFLFFTTTKGFPPVLACFGSGKFSGAPDLIIVKGFYTSPDNHP